MAQLYNISTDHLIRALRVYVDDLTNPYSPFEKNAAYLGDLAEWIAYATEKIEYLMQKETK